MSYLGYLTDNSLTAYPFKTRKAVYSFSTYPIQDDWFYDILFASFSKKIRSVYLSVIERTPDAELYLTFSNAETLEELGRIYVPAEELVDHLGNKEVSFFGYSCKDFAVKILLGPGLLVSESFIQSYSVIESELASSAVILAPPRVEKITFAAYHPSYDIVKEYVYPSVPVVRPSHNTAFVLEALNTGGLFVDAGLGAGLYDNCPPAGDITDVYSLNAVNPNSDGAMFITASNCYILNSLSENDAILLGSNDPGGYLYKYHYFNTNRPDVPVFDAVTPGHSLFIQNFCKPKCPPENLNAFAYYLNRITDGVAELDKIASGSVEVRGRGSPKDRDPTLFYCNNFCVASYDGQNDPFARCDEPSDEHSYIHCGSQFVRYFHEGRTLRVYYSSLVVRNYTILEVIDDNTVRLDTPASITGTDLWFKIFDNGVISNMNCAASYYNSLAATYTSPYFKVKYTTSESFNSAGNYVTYISVVVALYNPAATPNTLRVTFNPTGLTSEGSFKVRTEQDINIVSNPIVTLSCRQYAFVEAVYSIPCGQRGGALTATVFLVDGHISTIIGSPHVIASISGTDCPGAVAGSFSLFRATELLPQAFQGVVRLDQTVTDVSLYGDVPMWLAYDTYYTSSMVVLRANPLGPFPKASSRSTVYLKTYGYVNGMISKIVIDYVARPRLISPLATSFSAVNPLTISRSAIYTEDQPIFQIIATNMTMLSADFPEDADTFKYQLTGETLPAGLVFEESSGLLYGQIADSVTSAAFHLTASAVNASGYATNPQEIHFSIPSNIPPEVAILNPPADNLFSISNLDIFNSASPLFSVSATNPPIRGYSLLGDLPTGLHFNQATARITGRITETSSGSASHLGLSAINAYGESSLVYFTIAYTIYSQPIILYPSNASIVYGLSSNETTLSLPLFTITSLQGFGGTDNYAAGLTDLTRNRYEAVGLPTGLAVDLYTGKVYGKLQGDPENWSSQYAVSVYVTNTVGRQRSDITLYRTSATSPVINNVTAGRILNVIKNRVYTSASPLLKISATKSPSSFAADGLPSSLTCLATGEIVGVIANDAASEDFSVSLSASNESGVSESVACTIRIPVSILSPVSGSSLTVSTTEDQDVFTLITCTIPNDETLTFSTSALPTGLNFENGKLSGKITTPGTYSLEIVASTVSHGFDRTTVILTGAADTYSAAGTITDTASGAPLAGVLVSAENGKYTTLTDSLGQYTLRGFVSNGTYQVVVYKPNYQFTPASKYINFASGSVTAVDFEYAGPYIRISGAIKNADGQPIVGVAVDIDSDSTDTNTLGEYSFNVLADVSLTVIPSATGYGFNPTYISITTHSNPIVSLDFVGFVTNPPSAPIINEVVRGTGAVLIGYTPPTDTGNTLITAYQYSLNNSDIWVTASTDFENQYLSVPGLVADTTYSVIIRAVNSAGVGEPSNSVSASPLPQT